MKINLILMTLRIDYEFSEKMAVFSKKLIRIYSIQEKFE